MNTLTKLMSLVFVALVQIPLASAATFPGSDIVDITTFLDDSTYFNGYNELNAIDFSGEWQYTAIAHESGNLNTVSMTTGIPNSTTFSTDYYNNFGEWKDIDFASEKLFFEDSNGPYNVELDPFSTANDSFFRVFQLTADSNSLSYLGNNSLTLALGTIIVGFNDNGLGLGDADYDDMIVALQPSPVPIPASAWLFGTAILGFAGLVRKKKAQRNT